MKTKSFPRRIARRILPNTLRQLLGSLWGRIYHNGVRPVMGFVFDYRGGRCHVDGAIIEVPKNVTTRAYRSCFLFGDYEAEERTLIHRYVRPDARVLELGACIGFVSCVTNRLLADKSKHVVVEGNPRLISAIERNKAINQAGFTILNRAVSSQDQVTFYLSEEYIVGGTPQRESAHPVTVPGASLTDLHNRYGPFDTMIMDIEGSEVDAIPDAAEILEEYRLVILETHDWAKGSEATQKCRDVLTRAGLKHVDTVDATEAWVRDSESRRP